MSTYKPTKRICAARAKQGRRTKRIDIWMTPDEVAVLDRLANRMRLFTNGVPASRSFVCRKAIEVLGTHLRSGGHVPTYRDKLYLKQDPKAEAKAGQAA